MPAQILLVDDHPVVREGIRHLIERTEDLACCGEAGTPEETYEAIEARSPDVVLLDLTLGNASGIDVLQQLQIRWPELPVLILSMYSEDVYAERLLRAGASGYIMKQEAPTHIVEAIRHVHRGGVYVSSTISSQILQGLQNARVASPAAGISDLSDRELQVFQMIGEGRTNREIADALMLSIKTIESHIERIKTRLDLPNGRALVRHATAWYIQHHGEEPRL